MKAATYIENGPPSVLKYVDLPDPKIGPTDVLIRVDVISVEGGDVLGRRLVPVEGDRRIPGYSGAGTVIAIGHDVTAAKIGQSVAAFNWSGSHAELWSVPEVYVFPIPDGLTPAVAATIPVAFGTADDALFEFGKLHAGDTVLVRGATGGVGIAAVQLARTAGATVIATASSDSHASRLKGLGAHHVINYTQQSVGAATLAITDGNGVDLLVELAGGTQFDEAIDAVRYRGRITIVGAASGHPRSISFQDIGRKLLTVAGVSLGQEMHQPRIHNMIQRHLNHARDGIFHMPIARTFPLSDAPAAHHYIETDHPFGRVLMLP